jgi:hypothetical protein
MEMGQAASSEGDVARKAKVYYAIIREFQNNHMALEKVSTVPTRCLPAVRNLCIDKTYQGKSIVCLQFLCIF